jgi:hypothetical protein
VHQIQEPDLETYLIMKAVISNPRYKTVIKAFWLYDPIKRTPGEVFVLIFCLAW